MIEVHIFTDGSCRGNPGPGGWSVVLLKPGSGHRKELCGGYRLTTNNRMELLAAIEGLSALKFPCAVTLFTDSQYLANAINKGWLAGWRAGDWKQKNGKPRLNADLWRHLDNLLKIHQVRFSWLKGHAGHKENERCDFLAREFAARTDLPKDEEYEKSIRQGVVD